MDKKSILGLVLIGLILLGFSWYNSRQAEIYKAEKARTDSITMAEGRIIAEPLPDAETTDAGEWFGEQATTVPDSIQEKHLGSALFRASKGEETFYRVETDLATFTLSNKGGKIKSVILKDYKTYGGEPLELIAGTDGVFDLNFFIKQGFNDAQINTEDYFFTTEAAPSTAAAEVGTSVSMKLYVDSLSYLEYIYTFRKDDYLIDYDIRFVNMGNVLSNQSDIIFSWENSGNQNEKGFDNENKYASIVYRYPGDSGDVDDLGMSTGTKEKNINNKLKWIAFKQQFFSSIFIADNDFLNASMRYDTYNATSGRIKHYSAEIGVPFTKSNTEYNFHFYYGPNKFSTLKNTMRDQNLDFQRLVLLGWSIVRWVNRLIVIPVFDFLGKYIGSFGLIILILTLLIKLILFPFTYKSYLSMAKMRLLRPEIDEISKRYPKKEDALKKQQATMELYKKAGVSPMGGCLPLLLQFPILVALFYFFPSSIELRGEPFLWAEDLSAYDSIVNLPFSIPFYGNHVSLFTLLMAVSLHVTQRISLSQQAAAPQMAGMKFMTLWLMPIMLLCWFNNYASGLSYYYLLSNLITMGQTLAMRYVVNDQKLHDRMKSNATKPRKKSKWQQRYEEMVKIQQQQQQGQRKKK